MKFNFFAGEFLEKLFRHVGLVKLDSASVWEVVYWLLPEIVAFPSTVLIYLMCRRLTHKTNVEGDNVPGMREARLYNKKREESKSAVNVSFRGIT